MSVPEIKPPICQYCEREAKLVDSAVVYNGVSYGMIWLCHPCDAYVGVHKNSKTFAPLGELASPRVRRWRRMAHDAFDRLWKRKMVKDSCTKEEARSAGYRWLAGELELDGKRCHIGKFDVDMCKRVVELCKGGKRK